MNRPDNGGYRVDCSVVVFDALRKLQRQATRGGRGQAFISAFRRIIQSIRSRPNTVGEPMYRLPSLRLRIRMIVVSPLVIGIWCLGDTPVRVYQEWQVVVGSNA
jgi:hypothetical protein